MARLLAEYTPQAWREAGPPTIVENGDAAQAKPRRSAQSDREISSFMTSFVPP